MNINSTCPEIEIIGDLPYCVGDDALITSRLVDALEWEGGRGARCDFWRSMGEKVPE